MFRSAARDDTSPITTYDLFKSLAVLLMIVDHIGFYFFPDQLAWRAVGRLCLPIWFFLIGYARSRRIDALLIGGALTLIVADFFVGRAMLPLNILVTMIVLRLCLDRVMRFIGSSEMLLLAVTIVFFIFAALTNLVWEYGTLAFIMAMCGYLARNGFAGNPSMPLIYGIVAWGLFVVDQSIHFHFSLGDATCLAAGSALVMIALYTYFPCFDAIGFTVRSAAARTLLRIGGRYTLEIYVLHLILLKTIFRVLCGCSKCSCHPLGVDILSFVS